MNLTSLFKSFHIHITLLFFFNLNAQTGKGSFEELLSLTNEKSEESVLYKRGFIATSLGYIQPIPTGNNFAGEALSGQSGIEWNTHIFVFKGFFAGGGLGANYLKVTNPELVGAYSKSTLYYEYYYLGYDFSPAERIRIAASFSLGGTSRYKNKFNYRSQDIAQRDRAKMTKYSLTFNYQLTRSLVIYLDYSYRAEKTDIKTSEALADFFEKAQYHNFGLGFRFLIGKTDLISMF